MKKIQYIVTITFAAILTVFCFCSLFADGDGFSSFENRHLAARPTFSAKEFFVGDFTGEYETYLLDNFMFRDMSIIGYQSYSNLLYLDAFSDSETVLASVDVDAFVTAGGQEGFLGTDAGGDTSGIEQAGMDAAESQLNDGTQSSGQTNPDVSGIHDATQIGSTQTGDAQIGSTQTADSGQNTEGTRNTEGGQGITGSGQTDTAQQPQTGETVDGQTMQAGEQEQADTKLNNSLIISGDRIMMPTGSSGNLALYGEIMSEFTQIMPEVNVYSITGPTSAAFYASKKYNTGGYDQSKAEKIISGSAEGVTVVKAYEKLMEHKDEYIYFRSDVHWSAMGAYYAYAAFCESAGMTAADIENDFTKDTYEPFLGGLYSQIYKLPQAARLKNNPEQLDYYIPKLGHKVTLYTMGNRKSPKSVDSIINTNFKSLGAYKYACFAWGDQHLEEIRTDNPNGRKVLVLKDSYGSALIPFLVHNYSVVYVIDPKGFNNEGCLDFDAKTLIVEEKIDDVIFCFSIYGSARKIIRDSLTSLLLK